MSMAGWEVYKLSPAQDIVERVKFAANRRILAEWKDRR